MPCHDFTYLNCTSGEYTNFQTNKHDLTQLWVSKQYRGVLWACSPLLIKHGFKEWVSCRFICMSAAICVNRVAHPSKEEMHHFWQSKWEVGCRIERWGCVGNLNSYHHHSPVQQLFIGCLVCARHWSKPRWWGMEMRKAHA